MKILAIETSTWACSLALAIDGKIIYENTIHDKYSHSKMIVLMMEDGLNSAGIWYDQLDFITTNLGPGSFTGIKVGCAVMKAISLHNMVKFIPVNAFEIAAMEYSLQNGIIAIDARGGKWFTQEWKDFAEISKPKVMMDLGDSYKVSSDVFTAKNLIKTALKKLENGLVKFDNEVEPLYIMEM